MYKKNVSLKLDLPIKADEVCLCTEEEMKRLYEAVGEGYSAVGFNYSDNSSGNGQNNQEAAKGKMSFSKH